MIDDERDWPFVIKEELSDPRDPTAEMHCHILFYRCSSIWI